MNSSGVASNAPLQRMLYQKRDPQSTGSRESPAAPRLTAPHPTVLRYRPWRPLVAKCRSIGWDQYAMSPIWGVSTCVCPSRTPERSFHAAPGMRTRTYRVRGEWQPSGRGPAVATSLFPAGIWEWGSVDSRAKYLDSALATSSVHPKSQHWGVCLGLSWAA